MMIHRGGIFSIFFYLSCKAPNGASTHPEISGDQGVTSVAESPDTWPGNEPFRYHPVTTLPGRDHGAARNYSRVEREVPDIK